MRAGERERSGWKDRLFGEWEGQDLRRARNIGKQKKQQQQRQQRVSFLPSESGSARVSETDH
jgi:hypothetical protein